jgi:hypothetical protein
VAELACTYANQPCQPSLESTSTSSRSGAGGHSVRLNAPQHPRAPRGMLSQADVALEAKEKKVGETVEEISQPTSTERE